MNTLIFIIGLIILIKIIYDGVEKIQEVLKDILYAVAENNKEIEEIKSHTSYFKTFGKFK